MIPAVINRYVRQRVLVLVAFPAMVCIIFIFTMRMDNQQSSSLTANVFQRAVKQVVESFVTTTRPKENNQFNLLEDSEIASLATVKCTMESMNKDRLQQNHPCVIEAIRRHYLHPPADRDIPYELQSPKTLDPSAGQAASILKYLRNVTGGFFIECGALDGEHLSNTLYMERTMKWNGVLIEADQKSFGKLLSRRRKSYALPVCLSLEQYPTQVTFKVLYAVGSVQEFQEPHKGEKTEKADLITLQCFPLYSILLAIEQTFVDFFSLDVEGHELRILKTIPWHKVDIKTLAVEWDHVGQKPLIDFMNSKGYYVFGKNEVNVGNDLFFAQNSSFNTLH